MRVVVLNPLTHNGVDYVPGTPEEPTFIELEETDVRMLRGAVGQEDVPEAVSADPSEAEPAALPAPTPSSLDDET